MVRILEKREIIDAQYRFVATHLCCRDLRRLVGTHANQVGQITQPSKKSTSGCIARIDCGRLWFTHCPVLFGVYPIGAGTRTRSVGNKDL